MVGQGRKALQLADSYKITLCRWNFDMSVGNHIALSALANLIYQIRPFLFLPASFKRYDWKNLIE